MIEIRIRGEQSLMTNGMQLLHQRLKKLTSFIKRYDAGYFGFKGSVLAMGKQLGIARLEFTNEVLVESTSTEGLENGFVLHSFQGDAARISEFDFGVANSGLRLGLPDGPRLIAVLPQSRSLISMSTQATAEYDLQWSVHSLEVCKGITIQDASSLC